ncbi:class I SAM-dependent methyltransferase [Natronosporangium hydrolyticum]|uniref:Class I SAM-dependent methyltransferase n=1 Tax=Natronosporangium hydrolyticum TaxID=2811111 RepID=A0A895YQ41_9ACTN|nr:class I SAM-dependent methyltransferase [Natronosporangium hydrolyticum]
MTIDPARLAGTPGGRALDIGCGQGRHAFALVRQGLPVVALDWDTDALAEVSDMVAAMRQAGEVPAGAGALAVRGDVRRLPFPDESFDVVVAAEVLEHVPDDEMAMAELARVLRPGGVAAVTVPRWWPERICWALSTEYHQVPGGHVRIYRGRQLRARLRRVGLVPEHTHHAHALHSPYWWLRCLFGDRADRAWPVRAYHRLLVHDILRGPWWTRRTERLLNPVLGKSLVVYAHKEPG